MSDLIAPLVLGSIALLIIGSLYRLVRLLSAPVQRYIAITPAPATRFGVLFFFLTESIFFPTLFRASFWTWLFGWVFHLCLALTLLIHIRFFSLTPPLLIAWLMPYTTYVSWGLVAGLGGLLARRVLINRVRYISTPADYLHLLLILTIAALGIFLANSESVNVYEITLFVQSLLQLSPSDLSPNLLLALHVLGACLLFCLYPFSKLFHGPLSWFNPTRSQSERSRP